jgi:hypothetical protein
VRVVGDEERAIVDALDALRAWVTRQGEAREAWVVDHTDQQGGRHIHTFARKKDADQYHDRVRVNVRAAAQARCRGGSPTPRRLRRLTFVLV